VRFSGRSWALPIYVLALARCEPGDGWVPVERLARRSGLERKVLDIYLARARYAARQAGIAEGERIVEVRPGHRRLGVDPRSLVFEAGS
jgi:hypothetical protein